MQPVISLSHISSLNTFANDYQFHTVDASINYKRTFEKEDRELEFAVNSSFGNSYGKSSNYQTLQSNDSLYYGIQNANPGKENETQISVDFTEPLSEKVKLGVGSKITLNDINSSADVNSYHPERKDFWYDSSLSNSLRYNQKVYALYAEITFPVSNWFDVKAGTRYEYTTIDSYYSNAQQQAKTPGYDNWVPSIYLLKKLKNNNTLKLSYSKRIERPDYDDLNPFINTSDPKNITAGNPYLLPELGQRIELSYNHSISTIGSVMITAFYRLNENDIQPYTKFYTQLPVGDSIYYNVSVSTRENIGTEKNTGVSIFADLHATSKLSFRTNLFLFHRHIINTIDEGADRTSFNYRINANATYQFTPTLVAEFFGSFNSPRNEVQGKYPSFTTYNFAMRKQFWNKKGSLAFTTTNPFSEYVNQKTEIYGTNFSQTSLRQIPYRSFGINFTWKFGMLEFKKEKEDFGNDVTAP
jgi:outer membrane receptor protein involved in Fe transport